MTDHNQAAGTPPTQDLERLDALRQRILDVAQELEALAHRAGGLALVLARNHGERFLPPALSFVTADGPVDITLNGLTEEQYTMLARFADQSLDERYVSVWRQAHAVSAEAVALCAKLRGVPVTELNSVGGPYGHGYESNETREAQQARPDQESGQGQAR
jgi:hypothetical protein